MTKETCENRYAQILKAQGVYVITIDCVDWYEYGGFMMPAYLPHCCPDINSEMARKAVLISGKPFARWHSLYGLVENSEWWYILRKEAWSLDQCSANTRSKIRRGCKQLESRLLNPAELQEAAYDVCIKAVARYGHKEFLPSREAFEKKIKAAAAMPETLEFFGVFSGGRLVGFSENYIQDNAVFCESIWYDPAFLPVYSSYVLTAETLKNYLNERRFKYVLDGCRSLYHRSEIQDYLIQTFGFTKEYALLNVAYRPVFGANMKTAYAAKGPIWHLNRIWKNNALDKVGGILKQEYIRRTSENQARLLGK